MNNSELLARLGIQFPNLDRSILSLIAKYSSYTELKKGAKLISEGNRHGYFYLVLTGGVKSYYNKDSKEVCMWFSFENEIIATTSTLKDKPSKETIELIEDSTFIKFQSKKVIELAHTNLQLSNLLIELWSEHAIFIEQRLYLMQFMTSEARYKTLLDSFPEIFQKVSLTDIASFLGISRETLSRIRTQFIL